MKLLIIAIYFLLTIHSSALAELKYELKLTIKGVPISYNADTEDLVFKTTGKNKIEVELYEFVEELQEIDGFPPYYITVPKLLTSKTFINPISLAGSYYYDGSTASPWINLLKGDSTYVDPRTNFNNQTSDFEPYTLIFNLASFPLNSEEPDEICFSGVGLLRSLEQVQTGLFPQFIRNSELFSARFLLGGNCIGPEVLKSESVNSFYSTTDFTLVLQFAD